MNVSKIQEMIYNVFDFCLDTWSAFFKYKNWFSFFFTFIIIFFATKYFILPITGFRVGSSDVVRAATKSTKKSKEKDK